MEKLASGITRFLQEEEGVTAIEYGLIAALIAVVIVAAVTTVGNELKNVFNCVAGKMGSSTFTCAT